MICRVFVAAVLLSCTGRSLVHAQPQTVQALAGEAAILPCSFSNSASDEFPTVEWSKEGLKPNVVFLYRDGFETYEMKNEAFEYRTSLIQRELKNRNISLRISDVRLSDAGMYRCMRLWRNAPREITTVRLVVGAVSEPKLSFVSPESGGVTLQCEAECWLPEPEITFLDQRGEEIPAEEPKRGRDDCGCFTVTRRLTLQEDTRRVMCRVSQLKMNRTRTTETLIPVHCMLPWDLIFGLTVGAIVLLLLVIFVLTGLLLKRFFKPDTYELPLSRKSSDRRKASDGHDNESLLRDVQINEEVNRKNTNTEKLLSGEDDFKSTSPPSLQPKTRNTEPQMPNSRVHRIYSNPEILRPNVPALKNRRYSLHPYFATAGFTKSLDLPEETFSTLM